MPNNKPCLPVWCSTYNTPSISRIYLKSYFIKWLVLLPLCWPVYMSWHKLDHPQTPTVAHVLCVYLYTFVLLHNGKPIFFSFFFYIPARYASIQIIHAICHHHHHPLFMCIISVKCILLPSPLPFAMCIIYRKGSAIMSLRIYVQIKLNSDSIT